MAAKRYALRSVFLTVLLSGALARETRSPDPAVTDRTLATIRRLVSRSPGPWPDAWQREYVDTIHSATTAYQDAPQFALRMDILHRGFELYWEGLKRRPDRFSFEMHRAQIRWYVEHLMNAELPDADERQRLRDQYQALWDHAARLLLEQFPFLDPNAVQLAKTEHLDERYRKMEVPLLPIFLRPLSEAEVDQIKQRWHDLRYARVDLWRQLGGDTTVSAESGAAPSPQANPHYQLTQKSLSQLLPHIWAAVAVAPDYYRSALGEWITAERHRLAARRKAWRDERRLEQERSKQFLQTEYISFLLAALLETPACFQQSLSSSAKQEIAAEQQDHPAQGR